MQILALLLSLSFLVLIHELGHYLFARLFKTRVEKFYLFFNPYFSILRAKRIKGRWHLSWFSNKSPEAFAEEPDKTEWGIGWLPLGGYCSIAGMIDEQKTSSKDLASEPKPWEYRSKPAWQRLFIIAGGVLVNFVAALLIFGMILFRWGSETLPLRNVTLGYEYNPIAVDNGFRSGDIILAVNGEPVSEMSDAVSKLLLDNTEECTVLRNGKDTTIAIPKTFVKEFLAARAKVFATPRIPFVVDGFALDSPAEKAGLKVGDSIISLNDTATITFENFLSRIGNYKEQEVFVRYVRDGKTQTAAFHTTKDGKIGVMARHPLKVFKTEKKEYSFFEAIPAGIVQGWDMMVSYVKQFKLIFTKEGASQLGGFGTIGTLFPEVWNWQIFWHMTAFLSLILAFMNILPIPALDGGHLMFVLWEMITGRKPGDKFLERAQMAGMIILFALLIFANGNDLFRWLSGRF